jgi:putative acetyltransferase
LLIILKETPGDIESISEINEAAFGRKEEGAIVDKMRRHGVLTISLVAVENDKVVGHVAFSPVTIEPEDPGFNGTCLGPVAVLPAYQNKGIGSRLVRAGIEACRDIGIEIIVLVGHPTYYPRFGFVRANAKGLRCEYEQVPDEAWMVLELRKGALAGKHGVVKFQPEFREGVPD